MADTHATGEELEERLAVAEGLHADASRQVTAKSQEVEKMNSSSKALGDEADDVSAGIEIAPQRRAPWRPAAAALRRSLAGVRQSRERARAAIQRFGKHVALP